MKIKQLREAIRNIIRQELNENQPAPSKPERETTTIPARPGTKEKPDEKRRKIGRPDVKPAPKNLKEEEIMDKIVARFTKAKMKNESAGEDKLITLAKNSKTFPEFLKKAEQYLNSIATKPAKSPLTSTSYVGKALKGIWNDRNEINESAGGTLDFASGKIEKPTPKEGEAYLKDLKPGNKFSAGGRLEYIVINPKSDRGVEVKYSDGTGNMYFRGDAVVKKIK